MKPLFLTFLFLILFTANLAVDFKLDKNEETLCQKLIEKYRKDKKDVLVNNQNPFFSFGANLNDLGLYDNCLNIKSENSSLFKYYVLLAKSDLGYQDSYVGVCLPKECTEKEVLDVALKDFTIKMFGAYTKGEIINNENENTKHRYLPVSAIIILTIISMYVLSFILLFVYKYITEKTNENTQINDKSTKEIAIKEVNVHSYFSTNYVSCFPITFCLTSKNINFSLANVLNLSENINYSLKLDESEKSASNKIHGKEQRQGQGQEHKTNLNNEHFSKINILKGFHSFSIILYILRLSYLSLSNYLIKNDDLKNRLIDNYFWFCFIYTDFVDILFYLSIGGIFSFSFLQNYENNKMSVKNIIYDFVVLLLRNLILHWIILFFYFYLTPFMIDSPLSGYYYNNEREYKDGVTKISLMHLFYISNLSFDNTSFKHINILENEIILSIFGGIFLYIYSKYSKSYVFNKLFCYIPLVLGFLLYMMINLIKLDYFEAYSQLTIDQNYNLGLRTFPFVLLMDYFAGITLGIYLYNFNNISDDNISDNNEFDEDNNNNHNIDEVLNIRKSYLSKH